MTSESVSYATGIIASYNEKSSAFALDLRVKAKAVPSGGKAISFRGYRVSGGIKNSVEKAKNFLGIEYGIKLELESDIPPKVGLGENEAIAVASSLALAGLAAERKGSIMALQIDKFLRTQIVVIDDKILDKKKLLNAIYVPGMNFARLSASLFGGFFVAERGDILRRGGMEGFDAVILVPKKKKTTPPLDIAWQEALKGNLYQAMRLNSSLCGNNDLMGRMIKKGALTVATSENSVIGLSRGKSIRMSGKSIKTKTSNEEARILQKPKKILRVREFMKLKGKQEFYFL